MLYRIYFSEFIKSERSYLYKRLSKRDGYIEINLIFAKDIYNGSKGKFISKYGDYIYWSNETNNVLL